MFCAWLAWSRYRVVLPTWDRKMGTLLSCLDRALQRLGGVPTYLLTDNERTVTMERVAGIPIRHPVVVAAGRHYGLEVMTCEVADPQTKGGAEATVRVAKADLVPTEANLLPGYQSFDELAEACERFNREVNERAHSVTGRRPVDMLAEERAHLHVLPREPYTAAFGETRTVEDSQTIRWGSVPYSLPARWAGEQVWCRVEGEQLVIVGAGERGMEEVFRHQLSTPGHPQILDEHYPDHPNGRAVMKPKPRPVREEEREFLEIGVNAELWLRTAAAIGVTRVRSKMAQAVAMAKLWGPEAVDEALGLAASFNRFGDGDLASILAHGRSEPGAVVRADEAHSAQPGTAAWAVLGR